MFISNIAIITTKGVDHQRGTPILKVLVDLILHLEGKAFSGEERVPAEPAIGVYLFAAIKQLVVIIVADYWW